MTERIITDSNGRKHITHEPLLHPPKRKWVGLTEADVDRCWNMTPMDTRNSRHMFAYTIESKLKEKNNGN